MEGAIFHPEIKHDNGKPSMNEDVFPIQNGDIPMEFYTDGFFYLYSPENEQIFGGKSMVRIFRR